MTPLTRLAAAALVSYTSYAMCRVPVLPLYAQSLGAGPATVGVVMAMSTLAGVLLKAPAGALSDAVGRGAVLLAACLVFAALPFSYLAAGSLGALMIIRALHGSATALFGPVAAATVSELAPPERRGRSLGLYSAVQAAGQAAGAAIAGVLAGISLPAVFVASGLLGTTGLALVSRGAWPRAAPGPSRPRAIDGLRHVVRDPRVLAVSGLQAGLMAISGATAAFLPLHLRDSLGLPTSVIGMIMAVQIVSTLATRPLAGGFSDRVGRPLIIRVGLVTVALGVSLLAVATGLGLVLVASMVYGAGIALAGSATSALVTDLSRQSRYGAAHGVFGTIYDIGDAVGPIVAGLIVSVAGFRPFFGGAAAWALLLAALSGWWARGARE